MKIVNGSNWVIFEHKGRGTSDEYLNTVASFPYTAVVVEIELAPGTYTTMTWDGRADNSFVVEHQEIRRVTQPKVVLL